MACIGGHIDVIRTLLDFNVKRKVKNNLGEIASDCIGISLRTADGRRIAKLLKVWKEENEERNDKK